MQLEQDIPASVQVRVYILGPLEVSKRDQAGTWKPVPKDKWKNSKPARSTLKRLLVQPGRRLSREQLADDVWSESNAEPDVYSAISLVRAVIGKPLVKLWASAYEIAGQALIWTDFAACEALLKEAENWGHASIHALPFLEQALTLLERGELLEGEYGTWCYAFRKRAEDMLRQTRLWLAESHEAQGKLWQAGEQYRAMILRDPSDGEALQCWLEMLFRHGKRQEALKCFQDMKDFVEAQGFPLSPEIEQFVRQIDHAYRSKSSMASGMIHRSPDLLVWIDPNILPSMSSASLPSANSLFLREPAFINKETLHLFADLTDGCRNLSEGSELQVAEQILWSYLPKIELFMQRASEHREIAASIASQGYLLAASLVGHRNDLFKRLQYSKQALHYGKIAGDLNLQIVAMRQMAISFDCMDCPDKVLEIYERSIPFLEKVSPLLRSCIYADISGAHASLNHEQEAFRFLGIAYEHFPEQPEREPAYLRTICRYASLTFWDGLNHLLLGKAKDAESSFAKIGGVQPQIQSPERNRVEVLNYQVEMFTTLGNMEQACFYLEIAVKAAVTIGSIRRFQQEFALFQSMKSKWPRETQVQQLADLFVS